MANMLIMGCYLARVNHPVHSAAAGVASFREFWSLCFKITTANTHLGFYCFTRQKTYFGILKLTKFKRDQKKHQNDVKKDKKPNVEDIITVLSHVLEICSCVCSFLFSIKEKFPEGYRLPDVTRCCSLGPLPGLNYWV